MIRILLPAALLLCSLGCGEVSYPPPPQRIFVATPVRAVLDLRADRPVQPWATIVSDVSPAAPGADWRWAARHPEFQFRLKNDRTWRLAMRVTALRKVLDAVHAQKLDVLVNGHPIGTSTLDHTGSFDLSYPVPAEVFGAASPVSVGLDIDPCLIAEPAKPYCVLLHSIGFIEDRR